MRIDKPLSECILFFKDKKKNIATKSTYKVIDIIKNIDLFIETGQWDKAALEWKNLEYLLQTFSANKYACSKEYNQLVKYEQFEKKIRFSDYIPKPTMDEILFYKSSDINLYRKTFILENGIDIDESFFYTMKEVDVYRELIDDIIDYKEDMLTPNFNYLIFSQKISYDWKRIVGLTLDKLSKMAINTIINSQSIVFTNQFFREQLISSILTDKNVFQKKLNHIHF